MPHFSPFIAIFCEILRVAATLVLLASLLFLVTVLLLLSLMFWRTY
jgi:hypothetical protein